MRALALQLLVSAMILSGCRYSTDEQNSQRLPAQPDILQAAFNEGNTLFAFQVLPEADRK
jgi:hypothetical protein